MTCVPSEDSDQPGHQNIHCSLEEGFGALATHRAHSEDSNQTGQMPRIIRSVTEQTCHFFGFVILRLVL